MPVLSEESEAVPYATRRQWDWLWVVDPLDGTREFVQRNGEFTVNVALVHRHRAVLGVVHAPVLETDYYACEGYGAFKSGGEDKPRAIRVALPAAAPRRVVGSRSHRGSSLDGFLGRVGPHEMVGVGSSLKFCLVAEGAADVYPRLGPTSEWDTAAGQCVLEQAGGHVVGLDGEPLSYNARPELLNPHFIAYADESVDWRALLRMSFSTLAALLGLMLIGWAWYASLAARELANRVAAETCATANVQLLDGTVSSLKTGLARDGAGRLTLRRHLRLRLFGRRFQPAARLRGAERHERRQRRSRAASRVMSGRVDLHLHSTASDGRLDPAALVRHVADCGVELMALTDHDTVAGIEAAAAAARTGRDRLRRRHRAVRRVARARHSRARPRARPAGDCPDRGYRPGTAAPPRARRAKSAAGSRKPAHPAARSCAACSPRPRCRRAPTSRAPWSTAAARRRRPRRSTAISAAAARRTSPIDWPALEEVVGWIVAAGGLPVHGASAALPALRRRAPRACRRVQAGRRHRSRSWPVAAGPRRSLSRRSRWRPAAGSMGSAGSDFHDPAVPWNTAGPIG